jgi:hypothetical protein
VQKRLAKSALTLFHTGSPQSKPDNMVQARVSSSS